MRPAGPLSSSPYNRRINKDRQWSSPDTQSTRCNFLYFDPEKRKRKKRRSRNVLLYWSVTFVRKLANYQKAPLTVKVIFCLSGTHSSATSCIRRQTSVPTLFQSLNFVENKSHPPSYHPQIMYLILSCFLFMFLHIYDGLLKLHSVLGEHRLQKHSVLLQYDPNQDTSRNDVMLQSVITQQCYCRQRRLLLVSDRGGLWCTSCDFNTHSATVCVPTQAVDSQTNLMIVFKL